MSTGVTKRKISATTSPSSSASTSTIIGDSSASENYCQAKRARGDEDKPLPEVKKAMSLWQLNVPGLKKYHCHPVFLPYSPHHSYEHDAVHHYRVAYHQFLQMAEISNSSPFMSRDIKNVKNSIESVTYIENEKNEATFEAQRKLFAQQGKLKTEEKLMFHGTTEASLWRLLDENFDLDSQPLQVMGGKTRRPKQNVYGRGVYFSALPRVSLMYGDILVLCKVMMGTSQTVAPVSLTSPVLGPIPPQFDSRVVTAGGQSDLVVVVRSPAQVLPYCVIKLRPDSVGPLHLQHPGSSLGWTWTKVTMDWQCGLGGRARKEVAEETVRRYTFSILPLEQLMDILENEVRCSICLDSLEPRINEAVTLEHCLHSFHSDCLVSLVESQAGQHHLQCPNCQTIHGLRTGNMPTTGTIRYARHEGRSLPGYKGEGVIIIQYDFQDGVQDETQPQPGKPFYARGFPRTAFLPGTSVGQRVLHMLITAFKRGLTFTIGRSTTTGAEDCLTWNGIHHKTLDPGHRYPDMGYLDRVIQELKLNGVEG